MTEKNFSDVPEGAFGIDREEIKKEKELTEKIEETEHIFEDWKKQTTEDALKDFEAKDHDWLLNGQPLTTEILSEQLDTFFSLFEVDKKRGVITVGTIKFGKDCKFGHRSKELDRGVIAKYVKTLPDNLEVQGDLELEDNYFIDETESSIEKIGKNTVIKGNAVLNRHLKEIPDNLTIEGFLNLGPSIDSLGKNLQVGNSLHLGSRIRSLGDNFHVDGNIYLNNALTAIAMEKGIRHIVSKKQVAGKAIFGVGDKKIEVNIPE